MNIILIGYRGSGKTSTGIILAQKLNRPLISTDHLIEERVHMSIAEYVRINGWEAFRDIEQDVIEELSRTDDAIIDTGGGIILRERNVQILKSTGTIFFLNAEPATLSIRIRGENTRPSLREGMEPWTEVETLLSERMPLYIKSADFIIDTTKITPEETADRIIELIEEAGNSLKI